MNHVKQRRLVAAGLITLACAIVGGCDSEHDTAVDTRAAAPSQAAQTASMAPTAPMAQTSELQNWAMSATSHTSQPAPAVPSSNALAAPVIHTVD
ncbi:hypothetical protein [Caballeronia sp. ATUFL_M2_KS44]|uniref:hypothetical protein n=1 Tax=Caballeronia sp. ATUFL_M2_KS44 TaxID=2921767 RepID=UPI002027FFA9|nr:hypothetical protein [Caballeronia sp. ATUFL_M2_KS44]